MSDTCAICGCPIHTGGDDYATPTVQGRSHATKHHHVAERFFGRSQNRKGNTRTPVFRQDLWNIEGKTANFCYDCHEELLHNPVLLPDDLSSFAELVRIRRLNEVKKTESRDKLAGRIVLLNEALALGIKSLLKKKK